MKKVLVIEDQTVLRDLICRLLKSYPHFELVGATGDGQNGYQICVEQKPDFIILDLLLDNLNGIELLEKLRKEKPNARILVFSALSSTGMVKRAVELGVDGYVEKNAGLDELEIAIDQVANGQTYFSPHIVNIMRDVMLSGGTGDSIDILTPREREIVKLIAESYSNKEIADKLSISPKTAEVHRSNIMRKLDVHDVAGLTRYAIAQNIIDLPRSGS